MKHTSVFYYFNIVALCVIVVNLAQFTEATRVYAWGANEYGQLGINNWTHPVRKPTIVPRYESLTVTAIRNAKGYHFAIMDDGSVYGAGNNFYGQLGQKTPSDEVITPIKNGNLTNCDIITGNLNVNGLCPGKRVTGWGWTAGYMVGARWGEYFRVQESLPVYGFQGNVRHVNSVSRGVFVTLENGTVFAAGLGDFGKLGLGNTNDRLNFTRQSFWEANGVTLKKIFDSQNNHVCALSSNDSVWCWGSNDRGQLGLGDTTDRHVPTIVSYFDEEEHIAYQVMAGDGHSLALTCGGKVVTWGHNLFGQLGLNNTNNSTVEATPAVVDFLTDKNIVEIVIGNNQNFARTSTNDWYVWGGAYAGILMTGNDTDLAYPTFSQSLKDLSINHIAIDSNSVSAFGWNMPNARTTRAGCPVLTNECELGLGDRCASSSTGAMCVDTDRSYKCRCRPGYSGDGYQVSGGGSGCTDINECTTNTHMCVAIAACTNTQGSHLCACPDTHHGDGRTDGTGCTEIINECDTEGSCVSNATCTDMLAGFNCTCPSGFQGDGKTNGTGCTDINECSSNAIDCGYAVCTNTPGSYHCQCNEGYQYDAENKNCTDIDECEVGGVCHEFAACLNTVGSYQCRCLPGFYGNGFTCWVVDTNSVSGSPSATGGNTNTGDASSSSSGRIPSEQELGAFGQDHGGPENNDPNYQRSANEVAEEVDEGKTAFGVVVALVGLLIITAIVLGIIVHRKRRYDIY